MSVEAITWALRQPITHSSAKFVLVVLANCASADTGVAYPSIAYLASATGQDRKTVMANLARLIEWGLIEDTGRRTGTTKQIVVYRVLSGPDLFGEESQNRNSSENGTVPKTAGKSPVFPRKESQKRDTEPSGNIRNRQSLAQPAARSSRFDEFWEAYPKKVGRKPSEEKWRAKRLDGKADELIADVRRRIAGDGRWLEGFVPNPATYLTQERWNDDLHPRNGPAHTAAPPPAPVMGAAAALKRSESQLVATIKQLEHQHSLGVLSAEDLAAQVAEVRARHPNRPPTTAPSQEASPA